jgi:hypothetical protein
MTPRARIQVKFARLQAKLASSELRRRSTALSCLPNPANIVLPFDGYRAAHRSARLDHPLAVHAAKGRRRIAELSPGHRH